MCIRDSNIQPRKAAKHLLWNGGPRLGSIPEARIHTPRCTILARNRPGSHVSAPSHSCELNITDSHLSAPSPP
eukprot:2509942-Prorocentrum_lima.AAC.1